MSTNVYTIGTCVLLIGSTRYQVKEFSCNMTVGMGSSASCELLTGTRIGTANGTQTDPNPASVFNASIGEACEIVIGINNAEYPIFKGIVTNCGFKATAGGLTSDVSYTIRIVLAHIGAALGDFNIGNRVFTPHGQKREPFIPANKFLELNQIGSCETEGAASLDIAAHVVQLVTKYRDWVGGAGKVSPELTYTPAKLNTKGLGAGASSDLKRYILQATTNVLNSVQTSGSVLDLLNALCNEFFLQIIPTLDGLHICHNLPCYKADKNSHAFSAAYVLGSSVASDREILPPTAVWVPRTFTPSFIKLGATNKIIHNPLYKQVIQNNDLYFKYPETDKNKPQNSIIVEPPSFLKLLLNNAVILTESPNGSGKPYGSTTSQKAHSTLYKSKTKIDVKQALNIGQLIAKLLYCNHAYSPCVSKLHLVGGYAILNGLCENILGTVCTSKLVLRGANIQSSVVGYAQGVSIYFSRDSASLTYSVTLSHLRSSYADSVHSISKSDNLLYTGTK